MTALRTDTVLNADIGHKVTISTLLGPITGVINAIAWGHPTGPGQPHTETPTLIRIITKDQPVTIPWHAVISIARHAEDPDERQG